MHRWCRPGESPGSWPRLPGMNSPPGFFEAASCDDGQTLTTAQGPFGPWRPNLGDMGVVMLDGDGYFVSRRPLTEAELQVAWTEHFARHGLVA
jgi:hypothetical protein